MYTSPVALLLAFHGCDRAVGESVLGGKESHLLPSENAYDWLGHGIYFWENNPKRARDFAHELRAHPRRAKLPIIEPYVIGAVIDSGNCLNLLEAEALSIVEHSYEKLRKLSMDAELPLPVNRPVAGDDDLLLRELDCAVINALHSFRAAECLIPFDTVRGVFEEGPPLYPTAGFRQKTHIQICVRNLSAIKGYFRVLPE